MRTSSGTTEELTRQQIDVLVSAAGAAPSMHNTQPWRFDVHGHVVDVYKDESRGLPVEDPAGRAMRIAIGAAVFNLRLAAAHLGMDSWYGLTPDPQTPDLMARVVLAPSPASVPALGLLYGEIDRRHTDRRPAHAAEISSDVRVELQRAAYAEAAQFTWFPAEVVKPVLWFAAGADLRADFDSERIAERRRWVGGNRVDDGVPQDAIGPRPTTYPAVVRDLSATERERHRPKQPFEARPLLALLSTEGDDAVAQLTAGIALQRVLLTASRHGLSASFLNQPLEYDDLRVHVQELTELPGHAQMVIRFVPSAAGHTPAPRRSVADLVSTGSGEQYDKEAERP